jgi:uncharacterized OsmC-like protein
MLGTLNGALEVRGISMPAGSISATAEGVNEMIDKIPTLTRIHVHYVLRVPVDAPADKIDRALETHVSKCPTAQSLRGAVEFEWSATVDRV